MKVTTFLFSIALICLALNCKAQTVAKERKTITVTALAAEYYLYPYNEVYANATLSDPAPVEYYVTLAYVYIDTYFNQQTVYGTIYVQQGESVGWGSFPAYNWRNDVGYYLMYWGPSY